MTTIRVDGIDDLLKKINTIQKMDNVKKSIKAAAVFLQTKAKTYPKQRSIPNMMMRGSSAKAARMRRGFFAKLKAGEIDVPYRRGQSKSSENLKKSWAVTTENDGWVGIVGTNVSYAPLVMDRDEQVTYHKWTGWMTTYGIAQVYGDAAIRRVEDALRREVESG